MNKIYVKDNKFIYVDSCNRFIYDVYVFIRYDNVFSTAKHIAYSSDIEIPGVVEYLEVDKYITVECIMRSAPVRWLINNDFVVYTPPISKNLFYKKEKNEQKNEVVER